ncbi:hypothetical protein F5Y16DRAFT_402094 [Xylariaceae sp. FL0255]|nr:hypothetical protein F5Y16DRAFT_402094 [Xylariaceae sp. FL0255]
MQLSHPIVPSQRYSPASDYAYETHLDGLSSSSRQPLGESTGNVQPHNLATNNALCYNQLSLSPTPIHSIPTPPIVPTQSLTSTYGTSLRGERSLYRNVSLQESPIGNLLSQQITGPKNPIYYHRSFADYRKKVEQKERDHDKPVWPDWLEEAFLDGKYLTPFSATSTDPPCAALLLIPQLGRKKFSSKSVLYGRNMLITEYLWIWHWARSPPAKGETIPSGKQREKTKDNPGHEWFRSRKQVSSHIQVLKHFFPTLPTFHFIFPRQKDGLDDDNRLLKEDEDTESFKNNRVLISIANGQLPDERPNYKYFNQLLNAENDVFIRPKTVWVYVSSSKMDLEERQVAAEDGTLKKQITGYPQKGPCVTEAEYPHLKLNDGKDYRGLLRQGDVLLHEYTRNLLQRESSSVKEISGKWETRFPDLKGKLNRAMDDARPGDEDTSRCVVGPCDTFHFEVVLDLHANSKFPTNADLNGLVEFTISRTDLHNHSWRSVTSVIKPEELYLGTSEEDFWEKSSPIDVTRAHRHPCERANPPEICSCMSKGSRDSLTIPFPANSWANTFFQLAPFVTAERERKECEQAAKKAAALPGRAEREAARLKKENEEAALHYKPKGASPKDLLAQVAMYQEVWSAPDDEVAMATRYLADDQSSRSSKSPRINWMRRAVILWTFVPVHENIDEKGKATTIPAGCNWRYLTKLDPASAYHQQHAYVSGSPSISRDNIMSPSLGFAHHINAAMHENFSASYDTAAPAAFTLASNGSAQSHLHLIQSQQHLSGLGSVLDGLSHGLVTPPPTATAASTLSSSYAHSFDGSSTTNINPEHTLHHHLSFMSDGTSATSTSDHVQNQILTSTSGGPDPFLTGLDAPDYMSDFQSTSPHGLSELTTRYIDTTQQHAVEATSGSWGDTAPLSATSCTSDQQWSLLAAAAQAAGHHADVYLGAGSSGSAHHQTQQQQVHTQNDMNSELQQDTWSTWDSQHHQATEMTRLPSNTTSHSTAGSISDFSTFKADPDSASYDGRRRASTGLWDGSDGGGSVGCEPTYTLGSHIGLTSLRPLLPAHQPQHELPAMPAPLPMAAYRATHASSPSITGRKRSREDLGLDVEDDDDRYSLHSVRKLTHHPATSSRGLGSACNDGNGDGGIDDASSVGSGGGAPTADMGDSSTGFL